jgi:hypothetical protein
VIYRVEPNVPARISARLVVALTSEAALIEMETGRKVPAARKTIRVLLAAGAPLPAKRQLTRARA